MYGTEVKPPGFRVGNLIMVKWSLKYVASISHFMFYFMFNFTIYFYKYQKFFLLMQKKKKNSKT